MDNKKLQINKIWAYLIGWLPYTLLYAPQQNKIRFGNKFLAINRILTTLEQYAKLI